MFPFLQFFLKDNVLFCSFFLKDNVPFCRWINSRSNLREPRQGFSLIKVTVSSIMSNNLLIISFSMYRVQNQMIFTIKIRHLFLHQGARLKVLRSSKTPLSRYSKQQKNKGSVHMIFDFVTQFSCLTAL